VAGRKPWTCPRLYPGETIVILAGGPSLDTEDIATVAVAHVLGLCRVIAVNSTWRKFRTADVLYGGDCAWWNANLDAQAWPGLKIGCSQIGAERWPAVVNKINHLRNEGIETEPHLVGAGTNSGHQAINIAVHLGGARVLLLGYEFGAGRGGQLHHHADHPEPLRNPDPVSFARWLRLIETTAAPLAVLGIDIVNCSRVSAITCFKGGDIGQELFGNVG
jgi:hypothetical protein